MKKTKYILSGGTAFAEKEDLQKLSDYAKRLAFRPLGSFGYTLKRKGSRASIFTRFSRTCR